MRDFVRSRFPWSDVEYERNTNPSHPIMLRLDAKTFIPFPPTPKLRRANSNWKTTLGVMSSDRRPQTDMPALREDRHQDMPWINYTPPCQPLHSSALQDAAPPKEIACPPWHPRRATDGGLV